MAERYTYKYMNITSFNVLADAYTGYGDYSHVAPGLLEHGARIVPTIEMLKRLESDVLALQEVDEALAARIHDEARWQTFWTPKGRSKPDGCLTLVRNNISVEDFRSVEYGDGSGHVAQILKIGTLLVANTHLKWAPADDPNHIGLGQVEELLSNIGVHRAVILADCNDRPGGPVRQRVAEAGFIDLAENIPSAIVNQELVAIDMVAVRGMTAVNKTRVYNLSQIPTSECPSDHIPIEVELDLAS